MEPYTPPVSPKVSDPDGVSISWKDTHPYVEIWDHGHLILAGWLYNKPDMIHPPKEPQNYWIDNVILTTGGSVPAQAGLITPIKKPSLAVVPEPCLDACEGYDYEDKDINTGRPPANQPPQPDNNQLTNIFGGQD
jgi:hypothetical protein